ncbi:MAG: hypothetical protein JXB32_26050 [Deltaproteobacteria bacterium]|nr:hypothetical protein [Deltaproteobacteria bacterium]
MRLMVVAAVLGLSVVGCAEKVDCDQMEKKLTECGVQLVRAVAKAQGTELPAGADGMIQGLMDGMTTPLIQQCKDEGGKFSDAKEINVCLGKATCDEFAACMQPMMK